MDLTTKQNIVGKPDPTQLSLLLSLRTGPYVVRSFQTFHDLREYAYIQGRAYTHGVVDVEAHAKDLEEKTEKSRTPRSYDYFKYADLLSVDIDKPTTSEHTLEFLLNQTWAENAGLIYPSSSYTKEVPRWHLVYRLSERITDRKEYAALALAFYRQLTLTPDERLMSAVQLSYGTVFSDPGIVGKPLELTYVNEDAILDVAWLRSLEEYSEPKSVSVVYSDFELVAGAAEYQRTAGSSHRTVTHHKQSAKMRELVVIDALSALLPTFAGGVEYGLWLQMWQSAYDGSPTKAVFDYIVNHPAIHWSDGDAGKAKFYYLWTSHVPRQAEPYTVASLFWLAQRRAGWLEYSPYDVNDMAWELINVSRITDWTEQEPELPRRVALHSQTGLGKSMNVVYMINRLDNPKSVMFVPTRKLAIELAATLRQHGVDATLYFNPHTGQIKDKETLREARILVTTLQTFSSKVYQPGVMSLYDLVYVEESDQLISQFSLAGGVTYSSHITKGQAVTGFQVLDEACKQSGYVWFVDATMTGVTVETTKALCSDDTPIRLIRNKYKKPKADVTFLANREQAFDLAVKSVLKNEQIVITCDTKATATEFYDLIINLGLDTNRKVILITKDTENDPQVVRFMEDVNNEAIKYDIVIYNSVMASGVSITSHTPDVIIQVAEYLPPRANLQLLNRYRHQKKVYCYYQTRFHVYGKKHLDLLEDVRQRLIIEQGILGLPIKDRSELAELRGIVASMAEADYFYQTRSPEDFYKRLLREDGRYIRKSDKLILLEGIGATLEDIHEIRKARRDEIRVTWNTVAPIDFKTPLNPDMSMMDMARGLEHQIIYEALNKYIPPDEEPGRVYDIVHRFGPKTMPLTFFANQAEALIQAEKFFSDPNVPETAVYTNTTSLALLALIVELWGEDLGATRTTDELASEPGLKFLKQLDTLKDVFDAISKRAGEDYASVLDKYDTTEKRVRAFSRILLRSVGMKLGSIGRVRNDDGERVSVWAVVNLDEAVDFLAWRNYYVDANYTPDFSGAVLEAEAKVRETALKEYSRLNEADQELVMLRWDGSNTTFAQAVKSVQGEWS